MGNLTDAFLKQSHRIRTDNGTANSRVDDIIDMFRENQITKASARMAGLDADETAELNVKLAEFGANPVVKTAAELEIGTGESFPSQIKDREEVEEGESRSKIAPPKQPTNPPENHPGAAVQQGSGDSAPTVDAMLKTPINEIIRMPKGDTSGLAEVKKEAEFLHKKYEDGISDVMKLARKLVAEKGSLDLYKLYGEPFAKMAAEYGEEAATDRVLRNDQAGIKEAMLSIINNEEVDMGSMRNLAGGESMNKVASLDELGEYARQLGRENTLQKVAEMQYFAKMAEMGMGPEEAAAALAAPGGEAALPVEEGGEDIEVLEEAATLIDMAMNNPEVLTDEEKEVAMEIGDIIEDQQVAELGVDKVTTCEDWMAVLNYYGMSG